MSFFRDSVIISDFKYYESEGWKFCFHSDNLYLKPPIKYIEFFGLAEDIEWTFFELENAFNFIRGFYKFEELCQISGKLYLDNPK